MDVPLLQRRPFGGIAGTALEAVKPTRDRTCSAPPKAEAPLQTSRPARLLKALKGGKATGAAYSICTLSRTVGLPRAYRSEIYRRLLQIGVSESLSPVSRLFG